MLLNNKEAAARSCNGVMTLNAFIFSEIEDGSTCF
jgi:hypothetical protein